MDPALSGVEGSAAKNPLHGLNYPRHLFSQGSEASRILRDAAFPPLRGHPERTATSVFREFRLRRKGSAVGVIDPPRLCRDVSAFSSLVVMEPALSGVEGSAAKNTLRDLNYF